MASLLAPAVPKYVTDPGRFGFPEKVVALIVGNPTDQGEILLQGEVLLRLYQKSYPLCTDLVAVSTTGNQGPFVAFALRLFDDLSSVPPREQSPLENIKCFAQRFGLPMIIGEQTGRFFHND